MKNLNSFTDSTELTLSKLIHKINILFTKENEEVTFHSDESKYSDLTHWLNQNGAIYTDNLSYPVSFGKYHIIGAKAKRDIDPNEALFYIPKRIIIDSCELKQTEEFKAIFKDFDQLEHLNVLILTIFLLKENLKENSFWRPYLDLISADLPIFWENKLLNQLDDEVMIETILEQKEDIQEYYKLLVDLNIIQCSVEVFMMYYSFVLSRNFCVSEEQLLIVPFADSLNHFHVDVKYECFDSKNFVCKFTSDFDDSVELRKTSNKMYYNNSAGNITDKEFEDNSNSISPGEENSILHFDQTDYFVISTGNTQHFSRNNQVYNFYGQYSNEYLLKWYGFCYFDNKYDFTSIILHLPKYEDLEFDRLLDLFFKDYIRETVDPETGAIHNTFKFKLKTSKLNLDLLNYIRFFFFYEDDSIDHFITYKFDIEVEIAVLNRTRELLHLSFEKKSENFPLEEDMIFLNNLLEEDVSNSDLRLIHILIFRISQKLNILSHIKLCEIVLSILNNALESANWKVGEVSKYIKASFAKVYSSFDSNNEEYNLNREKVKKYFLKNGLIIQ